jgi:hypothetical protein
MNEAGEASGGDSHGYVLAAWKGPLIIAAISVSMVAGAYLGGPGLAMAMGSLAAGLLVVMAIRLAPRLPIEPPPARDGRTHLLLVANEPLESPAAIDRVVAAAGSGDGQPGEAEVLVLAPNRPRFVERWASDTERGERQAQRCLVLTLAVLAKAGIAATARIGDEDPVQAVDDQLRSYPATQVVLVDHPGSHSSGAARQLRSRLRVPFLHLVDSAAEPVAALRH